MSLTSRRSLLAGTTALALLLGALVMARPWDGTDVEDRLLIGDRAPGVTAPTPTVPIATTSAAQHSTAALQLPPWLRVELPRPKL